MKKVTYTAAKALLGCRAFSMGNTRVTVNEMDGECYSEMRLHGNRIARYCPTDHRLFLWDAGLQTRTTRDRLNGVLRVAGLNAYIWQHQDFEWRYSIGDQTYTWGGFETFTVPLREPRSLTGSGAGSAGSVKRESPETWLEISNTLLTNKPIRKNRYYESYLP